MFLQIYTIEFAEICIHQTSPQLIAAPPCSAAPQRRAGGACTGPRMHRNAGNAHLLTNQSHGQNLFQFVASLLKSDKQWKVFSACLEKFAHGCGPSDTQTYTRVNLKPSSGFSLVKPLAASSARPEAAKNPQRACGYSGFCLSSDLGCNLGFAF